MYCRLYGQSAHEPLILFTAHLFELIGIPWPLISSIRQSLIEKEKAIAFPQQSFDPITLRATEQEQCSFIEWVQLECCLYKICQSIDAISQVCSAAGDIDLFELCDISKHWTLPSSIASAVHQRYCHRL